MLEILVVGFKGNVHRASGILDELRVLDDKWILDLADAVAVHRKVDGSVAMDQSYRPTGRRAAEWGSTIGLLIGATLSVPFIGDACPMVSEGVMTAAGLGRIGIAGVDASFWAGVLWIGQNFVELAGQLVLPGDSAIFAILEVDDAAPATMRFQKYGGTILHLSLSIEQQSKITRLLENSAR